MKPSPSLIALRDVSFSYDVSLVLQGLSLDVARAEWIVVHGFSGGGKSTLLRLLALLLSPASGELMWNGLPYKTFRAAELRRKIALLQQVPIMLPASVRENLLLSFRYAADGSRLPSDNDLLDLLTKAKMEGVSLDHPAQGLSVGQKQRVAFIRLVLMNPEVLLLDEPTSALDPATTEIIQEWVKDLNGHEGKTIIEVSHRENTRAGCAVTSYRLIDGCLFPAFPNNDIQTHARPD